jgi:ribonuclease BN (tRNA processing enzyme)
MQLIVVGAGPAYPGRRGAAASSYLLRTAGATLLLDMGQGSFSNLAAEIEPSTLQAILVSHLHPDHFVDLVPLRHYLRWEFEPPRHVRVVGPSGLTDRIDGLHAEPGFTAVTLDVEPLTAGKRQIEGVTIESIRVFHTDDSFAFRISENGSGPGLVYSGDCGRADDLLPLIHPGDTLLSEASFGSDPVPPGAEHITASEAARVASAGGAARLLLTHLLTGHSRADTLAAAQAAFSGPIQLVTEGDRFEI